MNLIDFCCCSSSRILHHNNSFASQMPSCFRATAAAQQIYIMQLIPHKGVHGNPNAIRNFFTAAYSETAHAHAVCLRTSLSLLRTSGSSISACLRILAQGSKYVYFTMYGIFRDVNNLYFVVQLFANLFT
jgi:hypothetical protein